MVGGLILRLACATVALAVPHSAVLEVATQYGPIRGVKHDGKRVFRGIPYAAPPVGDFRFRPPQPHAGWAQTLETTDFGPSCMNPTCWTSANMTRRSEDCLTVNVIAPLNVSGAATIVYIHAGEFHCGSSNDWESNWPSHWPDIIYVSFNYRAGAFGFLAANFLRSRDPLGGSGNYGLLDQHAAIEWVHNNIAAFGGDPSLVTIMGESSGGTSVAYHLMANARKPEKLFQRAILESPGLTQVKSWSDAMTNTEFTLAALTAASSPGCHYSSQGYLAFSEVMIIGMPLERYSDLTLTSAKNACDRNSLCTSFWRDGAETFLMAGVPTPMDVEDAGYKSRVIAYVKQGPVLPKHQLNCLLSANAVLLKNITESMPRDDTFQTDAWAPVIDGVYLQHSFMVSLSESDVASDVDILAGFNLDEGTEFMSLTPNLACNASAADFDNWCTTFYGQGIGKTVIPLYEPAELQQPTPPCNNGQHKGGFTSEQAMYYNAAMRSAGDQAIRCPTQKLANVGTGNTFVYRFAITPKFSFNFPNTTIEGAFHGSEIPFVFGFSEELVGPGEMDVSSLMGCFWRSFAKHGDPNKENCSTSLLWPDHKKSNGMTMQFANPASYVTANVKIETERCEAFHIVNDYQQVAADSELLVV